MGVTVHDPGAVPIPSTMTNMRTGTSMMSGRGILANGKGVRREYGDFNLDDLKVPAPSAVYRLAERVVHGFFLRLSLCRSAIVSA